MGRLGRRRGALGLTSAAPGRVHRVASSPPYVLGRGTDDRAWASTRATRSDSALASFVAGRADNITVEPSTTSRPGLTVTFRPGVVEHTASTVKVDILGTLLIEAQAQGRSLTPREQSLAVPMIEDSLDSAADILWVRLGPRPVGAFERAAGMTQTVPATNGIWGTTTTTALDRMAMVRELVFASPLLADASRGLRCSTSWSTSPRPRRGGSPAGSRPASPSP